MREGDMACPVCGRRLDAGRGTDAGERTRLAATHLGDHDLSDAEAAVYAAVMSGEGGAGPDGGVGGAIVTGSGVWDRDAR